MFCNIMPSSRRQFLAAVGTASAASLGGCLSNGTPTVTTAWRRRGATNGHVGRVDTDGPTGVLNVAWRTSIGTNDYPGTNARSPVVADSTLYALDQSPTTGDGARITALDAESGEKQWAKRVTPPAPREPGTWVVPDSLVLDGEDLFFRTYTGLHRVGTDGERRWTFGAFGPTGRPATPVVTADLVIAGSNGDAIYGIDRESGEQRWRTPVSDGVNHVAAADGVVYAPVQGSDPHLLVLDLKTGKEQWRFDGAVAGSPSVDNDALVVPLHKNDDNDELVILDPETHATRWREPIAQRWTKSGLALDDDRIYSIGDDGLVARDRTDGSKAWCFGGNGHANASVYTTPTVAGDTVYVAGYAESSGKVTALAAATGETRGTISFEKNESVDHNVPAVTDGLFFLVTSENDVVAVGECDAALFGRCLV